MGHVGEKIIQCDKRQPKERHVWRKHGTRLLTSGYRAQKWQCNKCGATTMSDKRRALT